MSDFKEDNPLVFNLWVTDKGLKVEITKMFHVISIKDDNIKVLKTLFVFMMIDIGDTNKVYYSVTE